MINSVVLVGRLTKDVELQRTHSGVSYVRFILAVNRKFSNNKGEREADFVSCIAWRAQAENMAKYVGKGSQIGIDGRIETGRFERDGKTEYTTTVVAESVQFLSKKREDNGGVSPYRDMEAPPESAGDFGDDLPF